MEGGGDLAEGFGARVRRLRAERGWTQPQLSKEIEEATGYAVRYSPSEISRYERGRVKNPGLDVVQNFARGLGVPLSYFTDGQDPQDRLAAIEELAADGFAAIREALGSLPDKIVAKLEQRGSAGPSQQRRGGEVTPRTRQPKAG